MLRQAIAIVIISCVAATAGITACWSAEGSSPEAAALAVTLPPFYFENATASKAVSALRLSLRAKEPAIPLRVHTEYEFGVPQKKAAHMVVDQCEVRQQLTAIAKATGCRWEASGGWINIIPENKADDPDWILNKRFPGQLTISKDPDKTAALRKWFSDLGVIVDQIIHTLTSSASPGSADGKPFNFGPDPVMLDNPTLRDVLNAHEALFGCVGSSVTVRALPANSGYKYTLYTSYSLH
ncbi:MAG: hypothetical protein WCL39_06035 [Armatimonadota bacterium]